jgi:hypothetical protein
MDRRLLRSHTIAGAVTVLGMLGFAAAAEARYAVNEYRITVGIKGGENLSSDQGGAYTGDMVTEALSGSFTVEGRMARNLFFSGRPPVRLVRPFGAYSRATVKGTWSAQGTKWVDAPNKLTGPFTCTGTIAPNVPAQMQLSWKRTATAYRFTLDALQQEIYYRGFDGCPNDTRPGPLTGASPEIYSTVFSVPLSLTGARSISRQVSGPLAKNRIYFTQNCSGSCNLAWQGTVKFTRVKVTRLP